MKWLLITNYGNPGDEWARMGVERLIRASDPAAVIETLRRDDGLDKAEPRPFDRAVICGMPFFWSHPGADTTTHPSWPALTGWLSEGGRLGLAGVGIYLFYDEHGRPVVDRPGAVEEVADKLIVPARFAYGREFCARTLFHMPAYPCPSIFAGWDMRFRRDQKLCNLMPDLTHYHVPTSQRHYNDWAARLRGISTVLLEEGFTFMAHSQAELDLAFELDWPTMQIWRFDGDAEAFLRIYATASHYFGNRIHGAIVSRSFGARTLCVGCDTRLEAVRMAGGEAYLPHELPDDKWLRAWTHRPAGPRINLAAEWHLQLPHFV